MDKKIIDELYYEEGEPVYTDQDYDFKFREFSAKSLEKEGKIDHEFPITSLEKTYDYQDLLERIKNYKKFIIQPKLDGMTAVAYYENYKLKYFLTRGDGYKGELIKDFPNIPKELPYSKAIIRGELVVSYENYKKFQEEYALPRSFVVGNIKSKYGDIKNLDYIDFLVFEVHIEDHKDNFLDSLLRMNKYFKIAPYNLSFNTYEDLEKIFKSFSKEYPCDGLVIRETDYNNCEKLGLFSEEPKYAFAFKFKSNSVETEIKEVIWNYTKTGKYSPLAILKPINVSGSIVKKVTLFNALFVLENKIGKGSKVSVSKHGEIIPYIDSVLTHSENIEIPKFCFYCNSELKLIGANLFCINDSCTEKYRIKYYLFLRSLGLKHLGWKTFTKFNINSYIEALNLELPNTKFFERAKKELETIKRTLDLESFLIALNIENCSTKTIKAILERYSNDLSVFTDISKLLTVPNIGEVTANSIVNFFNKNSYLLDFIKNLNYSRKGDGPLKGKLIAITGSFDIPRAKLIKLLEDRGAKIVSIKEGIDYLLVGKNPTERKVSFAKEKNIPILNDYTSILD